MSKSPAASLRTLADKMQPQIDDKFRARLENTHKRAREAESQRQDGRHLQQVQDKLRALADAWDSSTVPSILNRVRTRSMVDRLVLTKHLPSENYDPALHKAFVNAWIKDQATYDRARDALLALGDPNAGQKTAADLIKDKERELIGSKIPGYFPTPKAILTQMLDLVDLQPGMMVLEPSAGKGNIADAITDRCPDVILDVVEWNYSLREILKLKGYNIIGDDCLALKPEDGLYDVVCMNPPFEAFQDIEHVMAMFKLVKPGGMLVSVMSESAFMQSKKAEAFHEWYTQEFGYDIDLPAGAFKDSERPTGVKTRLLVLEKVVEHKRVYESANVIAFEKPAKSPPICDTCQQPNRLVLDDAPVGQRKCWTCLLGEVKEAEQNAAQAARKVNGHLYKMGYLDKSAVCYDLVPVGPVITHIESCFRRVEQPGCGDKVSMGKMVKHTLLPRSGKALEVSERGVLVECSETGCQAWYPAQHIIADMSQPRAQAAKAITPIYPDITLIETTFIREAPVPVRDWDKATVQLKMF